MVLRAWQQLAVFFCALAAAAVVRGEGVTIAAAANLTYVITALNAEFARVAPNVKVTITLGASGNLSAQIKNGAPFDVFLSADTEYGRDLGRSGFADPATQRTFAVGRLVLWTMRDDVEVSDLRQTVRSARVAKLAIAQPRTAPYGRAAQTALQAMGVWADAQPKLVIGENIAQTAQFVQTGNADAGFVALSFVKSPRLVHRGHWAEVPPALYRDVALDHACILTTHGTSNAAARQYLAFLFSAPARRVLEENGYGVPAQ